MPETSNGDHQPRKTKRRRRLPWDEFVTVVHDPHCGGALIGKRGRIEGVSGGGGTQFEYFVRVESADETFQFTRDQLASTGERTFVLPPRPWKPEQIEAFIVNPPKYVRQLWPELAVNAHVKDLIHVLRHSPEPKARFVCCYVFHWTRPKAAREAVLAALFDPDNDVRRVAADTYSGVGRAEDFLVLMAAYKLDRRPGFRRDIISAFGRTQCQEAAPFLIDLLKRGEHRGAVVESLGALRGLAVRGALVEELDAENDPEWQRAIKDSIAFVDARARRDEIEANGGEVPRLLTPTEIERIVLNPPPEIGSSYVHLLIHASENELRNVRDGSEHLKARNVADFTLEQIRFRDKRGY
jgi:hypothetical protein